MNSLSWFLYLIDVVSNVKTMAVGFLVAAGFAWVGLNISVPVTEGEVLEWGDFKKWWTRGVVIIAVCGALVSVLPSKNTMYAIAASEVGERVVKSETVQGITTDATKALHQWIKRQIESGEKNATN